MCTRRRIASLLLIVALLSLPAIAQTRPATRPASALPPGAKAMRDIEYARPDDIPLHLDLFLPPTDKPAPVILYVHGGGWYTGDKRFMPALPLVAHGYAVASINYRLSGQAVFPAQIQDCRTAVRWLRANATKYNLDADRIGAWGASAGGHLVALLGTAGDAKDLDDAGDPHDKLPAHVQAVCDWYGPTDLLQINAQANSILDYNHPDSLVSLLLGGPPPEQKAKAIAANPITYIATAKHLPPFLIMHGERDFVVPVAQSRILYEALRKAGADATFTVLPRAGHGFRTPANIRTVADFFDHHLQPPTTRPAR